MSDFIRKNEIWLFLILAPLVNTLLTYLNSKEIIFGFVYTHGRFYVLLGLLIGIVLISKGIEGIKDMFRPMLNWKVNPLWYLFSLLFAVMVAALTLMLKGIYYDDFSFFKFNFPSFRNSLFLLTWAFVGEVVWVSYAVRELTKATKPFYASQMVGFVWSLWWLPSILINTGVILDLPIWPLFLNMMGAAGMCAIVYAKTKSAICVLILQFMMNMSAFILPVSPNLGGVPTYTTFAVLYFLTMLIFWYFMPIKAEAILEKK